MKKQKLGKNGPEISAIGFGAWEAGGQFWGPGPEDEHVIKAMRDGLDAGMSWIDTAEVYGRGRSEELVAEAVRDYPDVLVFTKLAPRPNGTGFTATFAPHPSKCKSGRRACQSRTDPDRSDRRLARARRHPLVHSAATLLNRECPTMPFQAQQRELTSSMARQRKM